MTSPRFNAENNKKSFDLPPPTAGCKFLLNHCSLGKTSLRAWCNPVSSPHGSPLAGSSVTWASRGAEGDNHTYNCLVTYRNQRYLRNPQKQLNGLKGWKPKQNIYSWKSKKHLYIGVSKNSATAKWMVKIMENPINMDDLGGKPTIFGNMDHMDCVFGIQNPSSFPTTVYT